MITAAQRIDVSMLRSIRSSRGASVFSPRNFDDLGNPDAVRQALSRLVKFAGFAGDSTTCRVNIRLSARPRRTSWRRFGRLMDGSHAQWQFSGAYAANALGFAAIRNHECTEQHSSRRDHRAVFFASRAARRPCPLSTTPTPLRKPRDRHKRHSHSAAEAAGFRLRLGGGVALRLRSRRLSVCAPLFPLADRRPKLCMK